MMGMTDMAIEILRKRAAIVDSVGIRNIEAPDWSQGRFRWEHYVDDMVAEVWDQLPEAAKLVAYIEAAHNCDRDDLDF